MRDCLCDIFGSEKIKMVIEMIKGKQVIVKRDASSLTLEHLSKLIT